MDELLDFLAGAEDPHTLAVVRSAWLAKGALAEDEPPVHVLGFSTVGQFRRAVIKRLLNQAAREFEGDPWPRAGKLAEAVRAFEARRWPKYRRELAAPADLSAVDRLLFDVFKIAGEHPKFARTQRGLWNLID